MRPRPTSLYSSDLNDSPIAGAKIGGTKGFPEKEVGAPLPELDFTWARTDAPSLGGVAMLVHGLTHLLTFNVDDFRRFEGITVVHPQDVTPAP